ncbi:hypothetical protein DRP77_11050, partial [Candidatus Poribacteria bacterium]
ERDRLVIYAAERGFIRDLRPPHKICAMIRDGSHLVVSTNGDIYTCAVFLGRGDEYRVGSIASDSLPPGEVHRKHGEFKLPRRCLSCRDLPICGGGCRYDALIEKGDITAIFCEWERFDISVPALIKAHYSLKLSGWGGRRGG